MHSGNKPAGSEAGDALEASIAAATRGLLGYRQPDGHWVFELEADCTIPAEYVLLRHYLGEPVDAALEGKIANYLRRVQGAHGGWPLVHDGDFDMSASVKAYFALKMIGDSVGRAAHGACARGDPLARRRHPQQRFHPLHAGDVRGADVAKRAGAAGRDHAAADVVAVSSQQDFVLGAHHDRAADGSGGAEAAREKCQRRRHR